MIMLVVNVQLLLTGPHLFYLFLTETLMVPYISSVDIYCSTVIQWPWIKLIICHLKTGVTFVNSLVEHLL